MNRLTEKRGALRELLFLTAAACLALAWLGCRGGRPAAQPFEGWEIPDVVSHLAAQGVRFHVEPTGLHDDVRYCAYLTTHSRKWDELVALPRSRECIDRWQGVVFCERPSRLDSRRDDVDQSGDCCLVVGPFIFFGDRSLLARIRKAFSRR